MRLREEIVRITKEIGEKPYLQLSNIEAYIICKWLLRINPNTILELGTAFGGSGKIIKTVLPDVKFITLDLPVDDNVSGKYDIYNRQGKYIWVKEENDLGKFLPEDAIQEVGDCCVVLPELIKKYKPDVVFHDSSHLFNVVSLNIKQCFDNKIKWIIVHDSHKPYLREFLPNNKMYDEVYYYRDSRGVSILKLRE